MLTTLQQTLLSNVLQTRSSLENGFVTRNKAVGGLFSSGTTAERFPQTKTRAAGHGSCERYTVGSRYQTAQWTA
jgi:hypothetical protein